MNIDKEIKLLQGMNEGLASIHERYEAIESMLLKYKLALQDVARGQMQMPSEASFVRYAIKTAKDALGIDD